MDERRDPVALLAADVGRRMVLGDAELKVLVHAAGLRQHTLIGERILKAAPALAPAAALVRSSHERYDGAGYPDGLVGTDIPLGARIIAACEAFEAMITWQPHNHVRTPRQALDELHRCAGSQFDPAVVDALIVAWQERAGLRRHSAERGRLVRNLRRAVVDGTYAIDPQRVAAAVLEAPARSSAGPRILRFAFAAEGLSRHRFSIGRGRWRPGWSCARSRSRRAIGCCGSCAGERARW